MSAVARYGHRLVAVEHDPFAAGTFECVVPSTDAQREVWLASALGAEASLAFNITVSIAIRGALQLPAFERAVQVLLERHQALRATFSSDGTTLAIGAPAPLPIAIVDLRECDDAQRQARRQAVLDDSATRAFDLQRGPLVRVTLLRLADDLCECVLGVHHAICDGGSIDLLLRELALLYRQLRGDAAALPPAPSFAVHALQQARLRDSEPWRADLDWWRTRLAAPLPELALPTVFPWRPERSFASGRVDRTLRTVAAPALRTYAATHRGSLFGVLLAGFVALLQRLTAQAEIIVAVPVAGNGAVLDGLVGHCVNLLPLRIDCDPQQPFSALLAACTAAMLDAAEHARVTQGTLLQALQLPRDPARPPLAAVAFNIDRGLEAGALTFDGAEAPYRNHPRAYDNFELSVNVAVAGDALAVECQYSRDLFEPATIGWWLDAYEHLLAAAFAAPDTAIARLPLLGADARAALAALQPAPPPAADTRWIHRHIEAVCARQPHAVAVRAIDGVLNYGELAAHSHRIAAALQRRGVCAGDRVGICLPRSVDLLPALLAVLQCGAAYVPLDPDGPSERLAFMLRDAGVRLVITLQEIDAALMLPVAATLLLDGDRELVLAQSDAAIDAGHRFDPAATPAYVLYTSGSTGTPKGVVVPHAAVAGLLQAMSLSPGLAADDRVLAMAPLAFDMAVQDLLLPLWVGAELVLASTEQARDPRALRVLIEAAHATAMEATPSTWRALLDADLHLPPGFRVLCGGEALPMPLAERLQRLGATVWNLYGPTETTVHATAWQVQPRAAGMALGTPVRGARVHVLDPNGQACPFGVPGEISIAGTGVALGYLQRPELDAERFVAEPGTGARMYRTGDRGRWCADGVLEWIGRDDGQVKLRGIRIELGEVETQLQRLAGVRDAAVAVCRDRNDTDWLVAYLLAERFDAAAARARLRTRLPEAMVPQRFVLLDAWPLNANGKLDRARLPNPLRDLGVRTASVAEPREADVLSPLQGLLRGLWCELLHIDAVGLDESFFDLGGHSLLAVQLFQRCNDATGVNLPLATLYRAQTIRTLAAAFAAAGSTVPNDMPAPAGDAHDDPWRPLVPIRDGGLGPPLFLVHAVGGNVVNYRALASRLPDDIAVYGLQAVGLDGVSAPLTSVDAMAQRYLEEILAVQPHGPYRLGGGSMGGVIAFEIARLLRARGEHVELLAMFDSIRPELLVPIEPRPLRRLWRRACSLALQGPRILFDHGRAALAHRWRAVADDCRVLACRLAGAPVPHTIRYRRLERISRRAYETFRAGSYDGDITLFLACDDRERKPADPTLGWRDVVGERVRVVPVPGTHEDLIARTALATALAGALASCAGAARLPARSLDGGRA